MVAAVTSVILFSAAAASGGVNPYYGPDSASGYSGHGTGYNYRLENHAFNNGGLVGVYLEVYELNTSGGIVPNSDHSAYGRIDVGHASQYTETWCVNYNNFYAEMYCWNVT